MRAIVYLILILSTTVVLSGCIKKSGYYDAGQDVYKRQAYDRDFHTLFLFVMYSFFCRKGIHNLLSGNGFPGSGSMWHRLVEVGTDLVYILNPGNQQCGKRENRGLIQT